MRSTFSVPIPSIPAWLSLYSFFETRAFTPHPFPLPFPFPQSLRCPERAAIPHNTDKEEIKAENEENDDGKADDEEVKL